MSRPMPLDEPVTMTVGAAFAVEGAAVTAVVLVVGTGVVMVEPPSMRTWGVGETVGSYDA